MLGEILQDSSGILALGGENAFDHIFPANHYRYVNIAHVGTGRKVDKDIDLYIAHHDIRKRIKIGGPGTDKGGPA